MSATKCKVNYSHNSGGAGGGGGTRWKFLNLNDIFMHLLTYFLLVPITVDICLGQPGNLGIKSASEPTFITRSEAFKFQTGSTISLPCEVTHPGAYVLAWKRGIAILTAGTVKVTPDPRVKLVNGYTLQIENAQPADAGDYICQIATLEPREITHHVDILIPPKIHQVTSGGHLQVKKGSPVRLECSASGNPPPNITWTRKNNVLPNGEDKFVSPTYTIDNMDRHKGGTYICTASNGVGQVASNQIILHVLYPPEITVERSIVHSGVGQEAMLVCIVHGEAQPEVMWYRDTMQIDQTERHIVEARGTRHTLIIRKVHSQDFGNYTCAADNQLGKTRKTITLTGRPNVPIFRSAPISQWKSQYNASWVVESYAPIEEYRMLVKPHYREHEKMPISRSKLGKPGTFDVFNFDNSDFHPPPQHNYHNSLSNDWTDIVIPSYPVVHSYLQGRSYLVVGLDADQQYEAKVQSRNRYGWSEFSDKFIFTTSNADTEIRDLSVTQYDSSASSSTSIKNSMKFNQIGYKLISLLYFGTQFIYICV